MFISESLKPLWSFFRFPSSQKTSEIEVYVRNQLRFPAVFIFCFDPIIRNKEAPIWKLVELCGGQGAFLKIVCVWFQIVICYARHPAACFCGQLGDVYWKLHETGRLLQDRWVLRMRSISPHLPALWKLHSRFQHLLHFKDTFIRTFWCVWLRTLSRHSGYPSHESSHLLGLGAAGRFLSEYGRRGKYKT